MHLCFIKDTVLLYLGILHAERKQNNSIFCKNDTFVTIGKISGFTPIFDVKIANFLIKPYLK